MSNITTTAMTAFILVRRKTFTKKDRAIAEEIAEKHGADKKRAGAYNKRLVAKCYLKEVNSIATRIGNFYRENTLPWGVAGERLLPSKNFYEFTGEVNKLRAEYEMAVDRFVSSYSEAMNEAKTRLGSMFRASDYADISTLRDSFEVVMEINSIKVGDDFRVGLGEEAERRIREDIENKLNKKVNEATKELWRRLAKSVKDMRDSLAEYDGDDAKRFCAAWRNNLSNVVAMIPRLNFLDDPEINAMKAEIETALLKHENEALKGTATAREETVTAADDILNKMGAYCGF